ncbi:MAG: hypothetical protein KatS3mg129_2627 [Leptospiraceae bacterium]|nr:MAG: hypothetical protein KatS3mg129_2627 [Leptospiraceae bacterium]
MDKKETLNIKKIYHEKIEKLYLEYSDNKNNEILGRGLIIVNELFKNPDLLILGNNPSLNPEHNESVEKQNQIAYWYPYIIIGEKEEDFNLNKLNKNDDKYIKVLDNQDNINKDKIIKCHHPETILFNSYIYCNYYYKFVKKIEEKLNNKICWEYFDLYWVRTINSKELENNKNKDNNLRNFLDEQAKLTIEIIKKNTT